MEVTLGAGMGWKDTGTAPPMVVCIAAVAGGGTKAPNKVASGVGSTVGINEEILSVGKCPNGRWVRCGALGPPGGPQCQEQEEPAALPAMAAREWRWGVP